MARQSAAIMVLPHRPSDDEVEELIYSSLEDFGADSSWATSEILTAAPEWMSVHERDQINAHLRDGRRSFCVLVIYMQESNDEDEDDDDNYLEDEDDDGYEV